MRPITTTLHNLCQHRDFTFEWLPGITGITGPNGNGKSNFSDTGLYFSFTGKAPEGVTKEELISWGADEGWTEAVFEHAGQVWTLRRNLHNAGVKLDSDKGEHLTAAKANAMMQDMLGRSFETFYETCWVPQGGLLAVLMMSHSTRLGFFQKLADVQRAEQLRGIVQEYGIAKLPMYQDRTAEIEERETAKAALQAESSTADTELLGLREVQAQFEEQLPVVRQKLAMPTESEHNAAVQRAGSAAEQAVSALSAFERQALPAVVPEPTPVTAAQQAQKKSFDLLPAARAEAAGAKKAYDTQKGCEPAAVPQPADTGTDHVAETRTLLDAAKQKFAELLPRHKMATQKVCPTCRRPFALSEEQIEEVLAEHLLLSTQISGLTADLDAAQTNQRNAQQAYARYTAAKQAWDSRLQQCKTEFERRTAVVAKLEQETHGFDDAAYLANQTAEKAYAAYRAAVYAQQAKHLQLKQAVQTTAEASRAAAAAVYLPDETRATYKEVEAQYGTLCRDIQERDRQQATRTGRTAELDAVLAQFRSEQLLRDQTGTLRARFERVREVLHRDFLPKAVMATMLNGLNGLLSQYLSLLDVVFTAKLDNEFDFVCAFPEKADVRVRALSGGQRVSLAIAFRLALSDLLSAQIPLIVMDEPSMFLDEHHLDKLREAMLRVREVADRGVYILLPTHEAALRPAFSREVVIG